VLSRANRSRARASNPDDLHFDAKVKNIGLLLNSEALSGSLPQVDRWISLIPPAQLKTRSSEWVDGDEVYGLYNLTEQADELAMKWSRALAATMAVEARWQQLLTYDRMNLHPLLVNRLFRGFFIQQARAYLGVRHILDIERPQQVTLSTTDGAVAEFASAACRTHGLVPNVTYSHGRSARRSRTSSALNTLARDIMAPALRHAVPGLPRRSKGLAHVVFFDRGVIHIEMLARAFDALRDLRDVEITIVRWDPDQPGRIYPQARYTTVDSYQNLSTLAHLLAFQARVMASRGQSLACPEPMPQFSTLYALHFVRRVALPSIVHMLAVVRRVIQVEKPNLLITVDETGLLGKSVALAGRQRKVPTLNIQHGVRSDSPWLEDQLFTRLAVFGERDRELFIRRGTPPERVVATGAARYDQLALRQNLKPRAEVATELGLDPRRPIVVFASQAPIGRITPHLKLQTHLAIADAVLALPEIQCVVKLHPGALDDLPEKARFHPTAATTVVVRHYDLYSLLNACDLLITIHSTVGLEAAVLDKPILIVNLSQLPDPIPYTEEGVAVTANRPEQVPIHIQNLLYDQDLRQRLAMARERFLQRYLYRADGQSAQRLAQLMRRMLDDPGMENAGVEQGA
jgi:hypothetical protein